MRRLLSAAATASLLLAQAPVLAEGTADDIGVMSVSLKETVKPRFGVQGQTQGAGTPNQAGVGGFLPISVGDNSVFYADVEVNADFGDYSGYSSIINTTVAGTTVSTSSRLGYRWLNDNRSWMYGFNAGYDSRPLKAGKPDTGVKVTDSETVFFQQVCKLRKGLAPDPTNLFRGILMRQALYCYPRQISPTFAVRIKISRPSSESKYPRYSRPFSIITKTSTESKDLSCAINDVQTNDAIIS